MTTATAAAIQIGWAAAILPASLVMSACRDWLPSQPTKPVRLPCTNSPPSHQSRESAGSTAAPIPAVTANVPAATPAWR